MIILLLQLEDGSPKTRKRWNWDDLQKPSQEQSLPSQSSSSQSHPKTKRKCHDNESEEDVEKHKVQEKNIDDIYQEDTNSFRTFFFTISNPYISQRII